VRGPLRPNTHAPPLSVFALALARLRPRLCLLLSPASGYIRTRAGQQRSDETLERLVRAQESSSQRLEQAMQLLNAVARDVAALRGGARLVLDAAAAGGATATSSSYAASPTTAHDSDSGASPARSSPPPSIANSSPGAADYSIENAAVRQLGRQLSHRPPPSPALSSQAHVVVLLVACSRSS
jgi:hypothetical protein